MLLVGETRHRVVRLRLEPRPRDASLRRGGEHRQPRAGDQIVDERSEKHGLARARQAGDAEAQAAAGEVVAERAGDEPGLEHEIGENRQGGSAREIDRAYLGGVGRFGQRVNPCRPRAPTASRTGRAARFGARRRPSAGRGKSSAATAPVGYFAAIRRSSGMRRSPRATRRIRRCRVVADKADADARRKARAGEQHARRRVVESKLFLELDLARPLGGEDLRRLLGALRARMNEDVGEQSRAARTLAHPARVVPAAVGQRALVIVSARPGSALAWRMRNRRRMGELCSRARNRKRAAMGKEGIASDYEPGPRRAPTITP